MDILRKNKYLKIAYSVIFNSVILFIALCVYKPFFEEIDDTHIAMLAEGAYGANDGHLIYVNIILGKLYGILYSIAGTVRWHIVLQYVMIYLAYVAFVYIMCKNRVTVGFTAVAVLSTFYEMYVSLQYTKTAAFLSAIGSILIFQAARKYYSEKKNTLSYIILAFVFMIYAGLLRFEALFIGLVPMLGVLLVEYLRSKEIKFYVKTFAGAILIVLALSVIDKVSYKTNDEWNKFTEYNKARTMLTDYRYDVLYYERYGEKLSKLGVSENDAFMILTYQFADTDVYSTEYLNSIMNEFSAKQINKSFFKNFYDAIVDELKRLSVVVPISGILILFVVILLVYKMNWEGNELRTDAKYMVFGMAVIGISVMSAIFYFAYSGRISHRLIASLLISLLFGLTFVNDSSDYIKNERPPFANKVLHVTGSIMMAGIVVAIGFNTLNYLVNKSDYHTSKKKCEREINEFNRMSEDKEHLYVIDTFTFQNSFKYEVFNTVEKDTLDNVISTGSWFTNSPTANAICSKYGYRNPYDALICSRGNVYLEDSDFTEYKEQFFKEHYNKRINFETEDSINSVGKYRPFRLN